MAKAPFDPDKFENVHQVGGILTGTIDHPQPNGGQSCRVAWIDTGAGLRFTVALDRGGDIVEARYNDTNLAYLTPNGYKPPSHAYQHGTDWLDGWPGGLVTTCGPHYIGRPRQEDDDEVTGLHGHHSNIPAAVLAVTQPDPRRKKLDMALELAVRDTRMFGPMLETRRTITATLGRPVIRIRDRVTNLGNTRVAHNQLYHCNLGYPLLDQGAALVYRGRIDTYWDWPRPPAKGRDKPDPRAFKKVPAALSEHAGTGERGVIVEVKPDNKGICHVGLVNRARKLAVEFAYPRRQLPRLTNWQHYGPSGAYVTGIEPFNGSLMGLAEDQHPKAAQQLKPGQTRTYDLTITVHPDQAGIDRLLNYDGPLIQP